ncbi:MAG: hypothetical protein IKD89_08375 [Clostridia bacterium]|nr:hypothetical protein [Clostridia bacterium]
MIIIKAAGRKKGKGKKIAGIVIIIIVVIIAVLLIANRDMFEYVKYSKVDEAKIAAEQERLSEQEQQLKENYNIPDISLTDEQIAAIESGEMTAEEVAQSIMAESGSANQTGAGTSSQSDAGASAQQSGAQAQTGESGESGSGDVNTSEGNTTETDTPEANTSEGDASEDGNTPAQNNDASENEETDESQAQIQALITRAYVLQSSFESRANALIDQMKHEFWSLPKDQQNTANKMKVVRSYMSQIAAVENECDAEMNAIIASLKEYDPSLASELESHYEDVKANTKASLISQYS